MHQCLMSLTDTIDGLSAKTVELTSRVAALEDISKKKSIDIPRDLSESLLSVPKLSFTF